MSGTYVGIDVAKAELVVAARPTGETWAASNDSTGIRSLIDRLRALEPTLVVLEATGGYELAAVAALAAAAPHCEPRSTWPPSWRAGATR